MKFKSSNQRKAVMAKLKSYLVAPKFSSRQIGGVSGVIVRAKSPTIAKEIALKTSIKAFPKLHPTNIKRLTAKRI